MKSCYNGEWYTDRYSSPSGKCNNDGTQCAPEDGGPEYGNGVCEAGENSSNCCQDCPGPGGKSCVGGVCLNI